MRALVVILWAIVVLVIVHTLTACKVTVLHPAIPQPTPSVEPLATPYVKLEQPVSRVTPLAWEVASNYSADKVPNRVALAKDAPRWSMRLREKISENLPAFKKAKDWHLYCPKFSKLTDDQKIEAIAAFTVAMAKFESGYDPRLTFGEPPPLGYDSIGLFQLSYEDKMRHCDMDRARKTLLDPFVNINCAIPRMAQLIEKDGVVAEGYNSKNAKGLARYWSVVREDHAGRIHKKQSIQKAVKSLQICQ